MKKFLVIILISIICIIPVHAEESIKIESIKVIKSSDGVILNDKNQVNAIFNDLNQTVNYEAVIKNNTDQKLYVNSLESENSKEKFIEYKLDSKSENMVIEPNSSSKVIFHINTLEIEGAGRNLDEQIKVNFLLSDKLTNPNTFSNIIDLIILLSILVITTYFVRKNKKVKTLILILGISTVGIYYVDANDYIKASLDGNIKYTSQNNIIASGTTLNDKQADYTNAKEVWAYYDKVKNVEVKSLIKEPKEYYKIDLTENKTGRVMAYLVENNDKDTPYDLKIMSKGVVIANKDSSFMFSFPKTEKVEGLSNVDFRNATTMQGMFIGNENLKKVEVEAIELSNTVDTSYMFYDCEKIEHNKKEFNIDEDKVNTENMFIQYLYNEVKYGAKVDNNEMFVRNPEVKNEKGNYIRKETLVDKYPIYYYRGLVDNNNVKFAGLCWQIVRTTETGGIKLIYNGTIKEDGTCNNTGANSSIGSIRYNGNVASPVTAGYMYGKTYNESGKSIGIEEKISPFTYVNQATQYYFGDSIVYENGTYTLQNAEIKTWSNEYKNLKGYYTCKSNNSISCSNVYYVVGNSFSTSIPLLTLKDGVTDPYEYEFIIGKSYEQNQDGTYTLKDKQTIKKAEWFNMTSEQYESRKNQYICDDITKDVCTNIYKISQIYNTSLVKEKAEIIIFGNDVKYENGNYTLIDTKETTSYSTDNMELAKKYHYTCLNNSKTCTNVYYIESFGAPVERIDYFTLTNGEKLENMLNNMFSNTNNSDVKNYVDNWYANNLNNYTNQLEDAIYCNERSIGNGTLKGINYDAKTYSNSFNFQYKISNGKYENLLKCPNENDRLTTNPKNGTGTLTYPIGLITADEVILSGYKNKSLTDKDYGSSYLYPEKTKTMYWTMTPSNYNTRTIVHTFGEYGLITMYQVQNAYHVRPVISLRNKIKYTSGNGTKENPYVIEEIEK